MDKTSMDRPKLIETVEGWKGLKLAVLDFVSQTAATEQSEKEVECLSRRGFIVDLDGHWAIAHAALHLLPTLVSSSDDSAGATQKQRQMSLIIFDTLELDYELLHQFGLLPSPPNPNIDRFSQQRRELNIVCAEVGCKYEIVLLAPVCDYRRLSFLEEVEIRKRERRPTVYYDRCGNPYQKMISQPVLQARRDSTCKSRGLAVLFWLLSSEFDFLQHYVERTKREFVTELLGDICDERSTEEKSGKPCPAASNAHDFADHHYLSRSLMSNGEKDTFGRRFYTKVSALDSHAYSAHLAVVHDDWYRKTSCAGQQIVADGGEAANLEVSLREKREAELRHIKLVLQGYSLGSISSPVAAADQSNPNDDSLEATDSPLARSITVTGTRLKCSARQWRAIEDPEERWRFIEEVCFFEHNRGYKKIKKYPIREIPSLAAKLGRCVEAFDAAAMDETPPLLARQVSHDEEDLQMFVHTQYIRKYRHKKSGLVVHEADACFYEPLEAFLGFLMYDWIYGVRREARRISVPCTAIPFPSFFMNMCLNDFVQASGDELREFLQQQNNTLLKHIEKDTTESDPVWHSDKCPIRAVDWFLSVDFCSMVAEFEEYPDHKKIKISDYVLDSHFTNDPFQYRGHVGEVEVNLPKALSTAS